MQGGTAVRAPVVERDQWRAAAEQQHGQGTDGHAPRGSLGEVGFRRGVRPVLADAKRFLAAAKDTAAVMLPCILSVDEGARTLSLHTEQATLNAAELDE